MITAILARSDDGVIGIEGPNGPTLPWHIPADLQRFKTLTTGHAIIMGRKTYDSIGRPLPKRTNIVISRSMRPVEGVRVVPTPASALAAALLVDPDPFVIGGAQVFETLWPSVDRIELTEVHTIVGLGIVMDLDLARWREAQRSKEQAHEGLRFHFVTLDRIAAEASC